MSDLLIQLADATSCRDVDRIVEQNFDRLKNPFNRNFFCHMANMAKRRIKRIEREKRKSFANQLN